MRLSVHHFSMASAVVLAISESLAHTQKRIILRFLIMVKKLRRYRNQSREKTC